MPKHTVIFSQSCRRKLPHHLYHSNHTATVPPALFVHERVKLVSAEPEPGIWSAVAVVLSSRRGCGRWRRHDRRCAEVSQVASLPAQPQPMKLGHPVHR